MGTADAFSVFDVFAQTVQAQYANSPTLVGLVQDFSDWLDGASPLNTFFSYVWDISTAQGFGLDIWGRILDVGRVYPIETGVYLGFEEQGTGANYPFPFGTGVFFTGTPETQNFALSDTAYRQLLLAKAVSNILDGGTQAINALLMTMFAGRGNVYVVDNNNMSMVYKFEFELTPVDITLVENSGVLPQPAGIVVTLDSP